MTEQIISLDMYMTAGVGVVALLLGLLFTRRIPFLKRFCIPAPVSGGLMISLLLLVLHSATGMDFSFDGTVKEITMMLFFTSVGFQSNLRVLKQGGKPLLIMVGLVALLIVLQRPIRLPSPPPPSALWPAPWWADRSENRSSGGIPCRKNRHRRIRSKALSRQHWKDGRKRPFSREPASWCWPWPLEWGSANCLP